MNYVVRKRDAIISSINSRVVYVTNKYSIQVPRTLEEAKELDRRNNNRYWQDAIDKEIRNVKVSFEFLPLDCKPPPGWGQSSGHLVFDVKKMEFPRKARWVKDGHRTTDPIQSTFAGVISRESERIALTYAALNGLDVVAADIQNTYL